MTLFQGRTQFCKCAMILFVPVNQLMQYAKSVVTIEYSVVPHIPDYFWKFSSKLNRSKTMLKQKRTMYVETIIGYTKFFTSSAARLKNDCLKSLSPNKNVSSPIQLSDQNFRKWYPSEYSRDYPIWPFTNF